MLPPPGLDGTYYGWGKSAPVRVIVGDNKLVRLDKVR